jgi:hypothetical protein
MIITELILTLLIQRKLQEPVVSCALGKLYNKDAIIEYLLDKSAYGDGEKICGHIRSLKVRSLASLFLIFDDLYMNFNRMSKN